MPSKKQYNLVHNDENDTRIPLHSDEAFHRGIVFHAKFIGSLEVPRPTSRVEIVAAMRRIRYEFKAKGIKKKKVTLEVSVDGLKVTLRKKKNKQQWIDENKAFQMHYPIYRIFYVSHDSHDLKIFSYIARDGSSNSFKCSVFKSSKKSQAMRVVRTVGQAFEVCHKLSLTAGPEPRDADLDKEDHLPSDEHLLRSDVYDSEIQNDRQPLTQARTPSPSIQKDLAPSAELEDSPEDTPVIASLRRPPSSPIRHSPSGTLTSDNDPLMLSATELSLKHELQLLRERLDQQSQQTRAAVAHAKLLQDQLAAETAARVEAQTRTHQLLLQNKELLEHIGALVGHLRDQEHSRTLQNVGGSSATVQTTIDPPNLGQPTSPWDLETYYTDVPPPDGEQIRFETQLLERLRNISPYSLPYQNFLLPSAGGASLRVSQASSLARGPDALAELQALIKPLASTARPSELPRAGPPPSRTTSARLPARADLAAEQRRTWARHTTK